ncbi:MAG TPA: hypothetical protein DIT89_03150 [Planctomycetaceae bacterium]|nr:hypothetical protein [Planctomycetaceae bacterium]
MRFPPAPSNCNLQVRTGFFVDLQKRPEIVSSLAQDRGTLPDLLKRYGGCRQKPTDTEHAIYPPAPTEPQLLWLYSMPILPPDLSCIV